MSGYKRDDRNPEVFVPSEVLKFDYHWSTKEIRLYSRFSDSPSFVLYSRKKFDEKNIPILKLLTQIGKYLLKIAAIYLVFFLSLFIIVSFPFIIFKYDLPFLASVACWLAFFGLFYEIRILFPILNKWARNNNDYSNW